MTSSVLRAAALPCVLLTTIWLPAPASAQTIGDGSGDGGTQSALVAPPAENFAVSPGGVDMRTGTYTYRNSDVAIGEDSESGGLALARLMGSGLAGHVPPFGNFSHAWDIRISEKRIYMFENEYENGSGNDYRISVHFGGRSETFDGRYNEVTFEQVSRTPLAQLTYSGSRDGSSVVYTFQAADGTTAVFRPLGSAASSDCSTQMRCAYVSQITHADGTQFSFEYDNPTGLADGTRLRSVTSSRGYALLLEYGSGSDVNLVARACVINMAFTIKPANNLCPVGARAASYSYVTYQTKRKIAGVTDPTAQLWSFTYTAAGSDTAMGFVKPGEAAPWLVNTYSERQNNEGTVDEIVGHQSFADGSSYSYTFDQSPFVEGEISQIAGGAYTDANQQTTQVRYGFPIHPDSTFGDMSGGGMGETSTILYQLTPGPVRIVDPLGRETLTDYCDPNAAANLPSYEIHRCLVTPVPMSFTDPEGIKTVMTWDLYTRNMTQAERIAKAGSEDPIVTAATFSCSPPVLLNCAKPTSRTDGRQNVTDYVYSPDHGGILSETLPAAPNGVRPQTRYEYVQRHAWVRNTSGGFVQSASPMWLLAATSSCRTSAATGNPAAPCATPGDEVRTAYDYGPDGGPNNLLLRGQAATADGVTLRTCYGYDTDGRRISETQPNANLSSCS